MRAFNFSPGPAALPIEVMEEARGEFLDWHGSGASVMEISHRGKAFVEVAAEAESDLRRLMAIPDNYRILFMQGGASAQFALVPMNLTTPQSTADYLNSGHWSQKGIVEAARYCRVHVAGDAGPPYTRVPAQKELRFSGTAAYVHYTPNETIGGVEFGYVPDTGGVPLVADMSSSIPLSAPHRRREICVDLCGRPKEHRSPRACAGDRARGPARARPAGNTTCVRLPGGCRQ